VATVTVPAWQRAVLYCDGQLVRVLEPGRHKYRRAGRHELYPVDLRPRIWSVPGQELLTADSLSVRVSVHAEVVVAAPEVFVAAAEDPQQLFHPAVQLALRDAVGARTLEQVLADREPINAELGVAVAAVAERIGVTVAALAIRDIMLPAELRRAAAEVVLARQRGLAELERARSEAAALRALANTARLLADHPELLRLRTLQAAETPGTTVVLTTQ
jgi:regulator of protease activity HflC (stomatin/prohibitin superfamily)